MRARARVLGLDELLETKRLSGPIIASIDLDYFAGMPPNEREEAFERV